MTVPPDPPPVRGEVTPGPRSLLSPGPASTSAHYRIHEWATDGTKRTFAHCYDWLQDAIDQANKMMAIEAPHRRPLTVKVVDVWTGEVMLNLDRNAGDPVAGGPFAP